VKSIFLTGTLFLCPLVMGTLMGQAPQAAPAQPGQPAQAKPEAAPTKPEPVPTKPEPAPPKPAAPAKSGYEEIESVWSFGVFYWRPNGKPILRGGAESPDPVAQSLDLPGKPKQVPGVTFSFPTGRSNRLEVSAFEARGSGSVKAPGDVNYFGQGFSDGDLLSTKYKIRNIKATWNYLTYPYPPLDAKFRIKTLWEVQYVMVQPVITGPVVDLTVPPPVADSKFSIILPTVGLGLELVPSPKHFRFEMRGTGMGFPGRSVLWDADAMATVRIGNLEVFGGGKALYFRSSPKKSQFMSDRLWGPIGGVRWVFR
jgi:hypothetical protein